MLVSNDIVDLKDPSSQPEAIHPRLDTRVFTPGERAASHCPIGPGLDAETMALRRRTVIWRAWLAEPGVLADEVRVTADVGH